MIRFFDFFLHRNKKNDIHFSKEEKHERTEVEILQEEITQNTKKNTVIRKYDRKRIKDIKIYESNNCFQSNPCLHDVLLIFHDKKIEETTINILIIYELWKNLSFSVSPEFFKHCKSEYETFMKNDDGEFILKELFDIHYEIIENDNVSKVLSIEMKNCLGGTSCSHKVVVQMDNKEKVEMALNFEEILKLCKRVKHPIPRHY